MTMIALLLASTLAAPAAAVDANPHLSQFEAVAPTPEPARSAGTDDVKLSRDRYDRMTAPVRLGTAGPFQFLVDTGSDRTAISRELAGRLGLVPAKRTLMHSATGSSEVALAMVPELTLSRKAIRRLDAPLLDRADMGADGILGLDSLRAHRVLFDFASQTLSIISAEIPVTGREDDGAIIVRARRRDGRLVITDAEAEGERISAVLDTGSELSVGNHALRRRIERRGLLRITGPIDLVSVTGESLRGEVAIVHQMEIGGVTLRDLTLVFADAHTFGQLGLNGRPAVLLGMNALRSFDRVSIDFASRKLRFVVPR